MPRVHPTAFIDDSAQVIGDVEIGEESSVWMAVVIRGDVHRIRIGRRSNVQDGTVVHVMKDTHPTTIGDDVTIGHAAVVHGCTIEDRCLIGMGAILLNGARDRHRLDRRGRRARRRRDAGAAALARDGQPGEGEAAADRRRSGGDPDVRRPLRRSTGWITWGLEARDSGLACRRRHVIDQTAGGTRDFLPDDVRRREHVIGVVRDVYERYGFEPLETPAFENIETLLGKYGEEGNKLIFKILRRGEHEASGEADLALRYDLTVPLARVVAQYQNELPKFFKRYQIQPVWRADRPARGRFREFYQCDIDAIGSTSPVVEVEVCSRRSARCSCGSGSTISSFA